jgi:hypothetical protein
MKQAASMLTCLVVVLLAGCGAHGEPEAGAVPEVAQAAPAVPDTLVLSLPGGNTVWLAEGRRAADSAGTPCFERSVEIRREGVKLKVPLLFTAAIPTRVDDSTFQALRYHDCRPANAYKIGVRDGMPHKVSQ